MEELWQMAFVTLLMTALSGFVSLPMPTAVVGYSFYLRLSVCFLRKLMHLGSWYANVPQWILETRLFWGQRSSPRVTKRTLPLWVFALLWVLASSRFVLWYTCRHPTTLGLRQAKQLALNLINTVCACVQSATVVNVGL